MSLSNNLETTSDMSTGSSGLTEEAVNTLINTAIANKQDTITMITDLNLAGITFHGTVEDEPTSTVVSLFSLMEIGANFTSINAQLVAIRARLDLLETP